MRVLGVDPGSRYLGFGLVDVAGHRIVHVAHGVIRSAEKNPLHERLHDIFAELTRVVATFKPAVMAVEGVFTHKNSRSALVLGHARGVALLAAAQAGLQVAEYAPARVKKSVGAGGNDGKDAVARMVVTLLQLEADQRGARADAYDALAVALCHAHQTKGRAAISGNAKGPRGDFASRLSASYVGAAR